MTAPKSYCIFLLNPFRIHHCTSCSHRKPEEHMGNPQHSRYLHMAFSKREQRFCFLVHRAKCVLLPNDQQGGPFLPQCLQLCDVSPPGYQIGTFSNIAVILSCLQQLKFLSPCRQALQLFHQQPRQKVTVNTNMALVLRISSKRKSLQRRNNNETRVYFLPAQAYLPSGWWMGTTAARVGWRSSTGAFGGQCATTAGTCSMPMSCAGS